MAKDKIRNKNAKGDQINVGDVSGTGIAIGPNASSQVNTGDIFNMSGDFRGALLNIKSTLDHVTQTIGSIPHGDEPTKVQLQQLLTNLNEELQKAPPNKAEDAEAVADFTKKLVDTAASKNPNKKILEVTGEGLKQAAQNIADVMPVVLGIATKIVSMVGLLVA
jgi:hypothetical protein